MAWNVACVTVLFIPPPPPPPPPFFFKSLIIKLFDNEDKKSNVIFDILEHKHHHCTVHSLNPDLSLALGLKNTKFLLTRYNNWRAERALSGEVDVNLRNAAHGRLYVCAVCQLESTLVLRTRHVKGNGRHGKPALDTLDWSMMKKTTADSKAKGKTWIYMRPARLIAVRERVLEFYSD